MERLRTERGFTLIEVLVALAIIAVAMSAAVRVAGLMTQSNSLLHDRSIALLAAQSRIAELRLENRLPKGFRSVRCDQGRLQLRCEQSIAATHGGQSMHVQLRVLDNQREAPPLARLETLLNAPQDTPQ